MRSDDPLEQRVIRRYTKTRSTCALWGISGGPIDFPDLQFVRRYRNRFFWCDSCTSRNIPRNWCISLKKLEVNAKSIGLPDTHSKLPAEARKCHLCNKSVGKPAPTSVSSDNCQGEEKKIAVEPQFDFCLLCMSVSACRGRCASKVGVRRRSPPNNRRYPGFEGEEPIVTPFVCFHCLELPLDCQACSSDFDWLQMVQGLSPVLDLPQVMQRPSLVAMRRDGTREEMRKEGIEGTVKWLEYRNNPLRFSMSEQESLKTVLEEWRAASEERSPRMDSLREAIEDQLPYSLEEILNSLYFLSRLTTSYEDFLKFHVQFCVFNHLKGCILPRSLAEKEEFFLPIYRHFLNPLPNNMYLGKLFLKAKAREWTEEALEKIKEFREDLFLADVVVHQGGADGGSFVCVKCSFGSTQLAATVHHVFQEHSHDFLSFERKFLSRKDSKKTVPAIIPREGSWRAEEGVELFSRRALLTPLLPAEMCRVQLAMEEARCASERRLSILLRSCEGKRKWGRKRAGIQLEEVEEDPE